MFSLEFDFQVGGKFSSMARVIALPQWMRNSGPEIECTHWPSSSSLSLSMSMSLSNWRRPDPGVLHNFQRTYGARWNENVRHPQPTECCRWTWRTRNRTTRMWLSFDENIVFVFACKYLVTWFVSVINMCYIGNFQSSGCSYRLITFFI